MLITAGGPWVATQSYWWGVFLAFVSLLASSFAGSLYSERFLAIIRRKGFRCDACNARIGLSDAQEAFRIAGRFGNLPDEARVFVECFNCKHLSEVPWRDAWEEMCDHLDDLASGARGFNVGYRNDKDEDVRSRAIAAGRFADKAHALTRSVKLGDYEYATEEEVLVVLSHFRRSQWPREDSERERLYDFIAATLRLQRLATE